MPIYEYQGQQYEIETDDKEVAKQKILKYLEGGKKPESNMPKPVEGEGGAAFGVYRPAGRRPESQQDREASKEMPLQTARGVVTGALGMPSDILNLPGSVYSAVTKEPAPYKVPLGSEEWNQMLPGQPTSPQGELARQAGQLLSPSAVGPIVKTVAPTAKYVGELGADVIRAGASPIQTAKTAMEAFGRGYGNPAVRGVEEQGSRLMPIRPTYVEPAQVKEFMAGQRPATSLTEVPTERLTQNNAFNRFAYNMAPEVQGQKLVAPKGHALEGYMENLGATYRESPLMGALDVASGLTGLLTTGVPTPVSAIAKTVPALAARQLTKATGFEPGFGPARAAALQREGQMGIQAAMPPTQNLLPSPGPVQPMIASQSGQVTAPGGLPLPTKASGSPKQVSMEVAASKLQQPAVPQQQSWQQRAGAGYQPPAMETPQPQPKVTKPVAPVKPQPMPPAAPVEGHRASSVIRKELDMISRQSDELHQAGLESGIKYGTPEGESYQAQLGQLNARTKVLEKELQEAIKAEKKSARKK